MVKSGPKPKPSKLKLVRGNPGKRPLNEAEPKPEPNANVPAAPRHLSKDALKEWQRVCSDLVALGILTNLDRAALAAYCQSYGRWVQAERALAKIEGKADSLTVETQSGNTIQSPLVGIANKAMADMVRYSAEFGMTPSARTRVHAEPVQEDNPFAQFD